MPPAAGMRVRLQLGLLHLALAGDEDDEATRGEVAHRHAGGHALALAQRQEVHHGLALGLAPALGDLVDLEPVHLAEVGEEQQVGVGGGDEQVLDDVLLLRLHPGHALAAPPLASVGLHVGALDVAGARDGDHHLLVGQQVLDGQLGGLGQDLRAPPVAVLLLDGQQLVPDEPHQLGLGGQDALQLLDELQDLLVLLDDLLALEGGQPSELHVEDGLGLDLGEVEPGHQGVAGRVGVLGLADDADHEVELLDGLAQAGQDVGALLGAGQVVARAAGDDLAPELDEGLEHLLEVHHLRPAVDEGQHDDAERRLHLGVLVELVQDDLGDLPPPQLHDDPDTFAVGLVADLRDAVDLPLA